MKQYMLALLAAATLVACSETTDPNPVDPNPDNGVTGADTTLVSQLGDIVKVDIRKGNSTFLKSYNVFMFSPSKTQHDVTLSSPKGLSSGSVTVSVMKNEETLWQHTFTTDSTTWNAAGQIQGSIGTIKVRSINATGRIEGSIVGR